MFGDDRDTIYKTNYADDEGTEALTNYLQHDQQAVRDRAGRKMSKKEIEQFNDKAAGKRNRHIIISPRDHITDLFVGDFAESGDFSIREYMDDPDGRVLVLDYPTRQSGTTAPVFRYLIDQSIMHGMDDPDRSAYYLLDEIEHLDATIKRLGKLINVGRGVNCQAILSLQSVAQLEDTYGKERAHALLSGMVTVIGLRTADDESVDFLREAVGTSFEQYTRSSGDDRTPSEREQREEYRFAKGDLRNFDPGEAVICRQGTGWVHGRIQLLEE